MRRLTLPIAALALLGTIALAQRIPDVNLGAPAFTSRTYFSPSSVDTTTDVEVFLTIPHNSLQFVRFSDFFRAEFDVLLALYDNDRLISKLHHRDLSEVGTWAETSSRDGSFAGSYILREIPAGEYRLHISLVDAESGGKSTREAKIVVPHFPRETASLGSIVLLGAERNHIESADYYP
ncbi:MAG TPA: hypothetical protein ENN07_01680, partial [candidate division Zixibacteria bacterium]|nr:hypothetical protein [candidate division Zixibacteria bacterium]